MVAVVAALESGLRGHGVDVNVECSLGFSYRRGSPCVYIEVFIVHVVLLVESYTRTTTSGADRSVDYVYCLKILCVTVCHKVPVDTRKR